MELDFRKDPSLFGRLVDSLPLGVFTVDRDGRFVSWSEGAEQITGYPRAEIVGESCSILEGQNCKGFSALHDMLKNPDPAMLEGVHSQECKVLSKKGQVLYIHGSVRLLSELDIASGQNCVAGAVGCFSDLTEFVLANEKISLLEEQTQQRDAFERMTGRSAAMQDVFRRLRLAGQSDVTVFLSGESGTGKELAAQAIHSVSARGQRPFIAVNCSAIPETLLESELFGHVKGAFTGAVRDKTGLFQAAEGGTLFLDEIGDLSPLLQLKLLRALQEREIRRVGDEAVTPIDVRLITATNRDLKELIENGDFREDFYYRIHVFEIHLPPLRKRREDIPLLATRFIDEQAKAQRRTVTGISRDALQRMLDYEWPGNVRELRNAIEHAFVTVQGETITMFDLPIEIRMQQLLVEPMNSQQESRISDSISAPIDLSELTPQQVADRERMIAALKETGGNKTAAAKLLGISRVTMWKKTRKFGLD